MNEISQKQLEAKKEDTQKSLVEPYSTDKVKSILKRSTYLENEPDWMLKELGTLMPKCFGAKGKERKKLEGEMNEKAKKAVTIIGLETHYPLAGMISEGLRPLVLEIVGQIEKEYDCKTATEKILAEMAAGAYVRALEYGQIFNNYTRVEFLTHEKNNYYAIMSKETDRSFRQFTSAISFIKQIKSPPIEFNIRAKAAFISQNQQINANLSKESNIENNEAR